MSDVQSIVAGLSEAERLALTRDWDAFCSCDYGDMSCKYDGFTDRLESAGFVILDAVDEYDLDQAFADELGIVPGGSVFRLTPLGLKVRHALTNSEGGGE